MPIQNRGMFYLRSYDLGDSIGAATFTDNLARGSNEQTAMVYAGLTDDVWTASHAGYLAFLSAAGNYGYVQYDCQLVDDTSTISFFGGAYESVAGQSITIGATNPPAAVPLPAAACRGLDAAGGIGRFGSTWPRGEGQRLRRAFGSEPIHPTPLV